jgi:hypothetical protein
MHERLIKTAIFVGSLPGVAFVAYLVLNLTVSVS